jgi:hypothetical protein
MTERSARFALPFILPGQAQKEMFHNEALAAVDGLLHPAVEGASAAPPVDPEDGACWIVAAGATGAWNDQDGQIALATGGDWRFLVPVAGMSIWDKSAGFARRWTGSGWSDGKVAAAGLTVDGEQVVGPRLSALGIPSGGSVVDVEARAAVAALIVTLKSHGLTD